MLNGTVEQVVKHSFVYSYLLSQPFSTYVDAYPVLQNELLLQAENLEYGQHGESVRILQKKLNTLSYYDDNVDGEYGIFTEYALKKFQSDHNIRISGLANEETLIALIEEEKEKQLEKLADLSESVYPGMHGENVKIVQESLQYFGYYEGEIDGIYGPLTKKALEIAEEEHGIELTNEVTQSSLKTLYESDQHEEDVPNKEVTNNDIGQDNNQQNQAQKQEKEEKQVEEKQIKEQTNETNEIKNIEVKPSNSTNIIESARSFLGTPYVWGGESPSGFDCSGFIQYVFQTQDILTPRTVSETWNFAQPVNSASVGDLVFFETYKPGPSHMGIYLGDGKFIHAGASRGVEISEMQNSYWSSKYLGAKRIK